LVKSNWWESEWRNEMLIDEVLTGTMELDSKSLLKKHYGTSEEFSKYGISNETDTVSEGYDKGI
jgi:hypothetical protein